MSAHPCGISCGACPLLPYCGDPIPVDDPDVDPAEAALYGSGELDLVRGPA